MGSGARLKIKSLHCCAPAGKPRGYAFVEFEHKNDMKQVGAPRVSQPLLLSGRCSLGRARSGLPGAWQQVLSGAVRCTAAWQNGGVCWAGSGAQGARHWQHRSAAYPLRTARMWSTCTRHPVPRNLSAAGLVGRPPSCPLCEGSKRVLLSPRLPRPPSPLQRGTPATGAQHPCPTCLRRLNIWFATATSTPRPTRWLMAARLRTSGCWWMWSADAPCPPGAPLGPLFVFLPALEGGIRGAAVGRDRMQ